ncbi:glycosyltransferase [Aeromonas media]|uniref:glycosyltransferase n=1 Tax=Aeromonas media TaxID=651 RepID=UPI0011186B69|nr:glycosyltransferase [Aeromonas media]
MIVIVAPYSPPSRYKDSHLGASRKLETIVSVLSKLDSKLVLINSGHGRVDVAPLSVSNAKIAGVELIEIIPSTSSNRQIGKFKNILCINSVLNEVEKIGKPTAFWFYNGYSFEMALALKSRKKYNVPMILEFEDWHFSRSRGLNPKPYIDYLLWRLAARLMSGSFVVNSFLKSIMLKYSNEIHLLPGIVPSCLATIAKSSFPFTSVDRVKVGFFSGLNVEKGADIVLELASQLPEKYEIHVTGTGKLADDFKSLAEKRPNLYYHGRVDDHELYKIISNCDVLLNPHSSIEHMGNGVFPFKVIEAIASGRLLISTKVPSENVEKLLSAVHFVEHTTEDFMLSIINSEQIFRKNKKTIESSALMANKLFGEDALLLKIKHIINGCNA